MSQGFQLDASSSICVAYACLIYSGSSSQDPRMTDAKINDIANLFERVWAVKNSQEFEEFMNRFSDKSEL